MSILFKTENVSVRFSFMGENPSVYITDENGDEITLSAGDFLELFDCFHGIDARDFFGLMELHKPRLDESEEH